LLDVFSCSDSLVENHCFDATCSVKVSAAFATEPCVCTDENVGVMFSECNTTTNTRDLYYFWKPPATCINGTLPLPFRGIPCGIHCSPGTFLNLTSLSCQPCSIGSSSLGTGYIWSNWNYLPAQFVTNCASVYTNGNCAMWQLNGENIDSGNNRQWHNLRSTLELRIHLDLPGTLLFTYKVSAETYFDGLYFMVDNAAIFFTSNIAWTTFNYTLSPGYHSLQWVYSKDFSVTAGEDKATISMISITGLSYGFTECVPCIPGYYSNTSGSRNCIECPAGFYSDTLGSSLCKQCLPGTYSFPGSSLCIPSRKCSVSISDSVDITSYYTPCINGSHILKFDWLYPRACDAIGNSSILPSNISSSCEPTPCPPGQERIGADQCAYCPLGQMTTVPGSKCRPCQVGSVTNWRIFYLTNWIYPFPSSTGQFSSGCSGATCLTRTWRFGHWFIDSGIGHGEDANAWLQWNIKAFRKATLQFNFSMSCDDPKNSLVFSINGNTMQEYFCVPDNQSELCPFKFSVSTFSLESVPNPEINDNSQPAIQLYTLRWTYVHRSAASNSTCDRVLISNLTLLGIAEGDGGSTGCDLCPPGSIAPEAGYSQCVPCDPGFTSDLERSQCVTCPLDSIADVAGSPSCIPCGNGTSSNVNRTACVFDCGSVSVPNIYSEYNLTLFRSFTFPYFPEYVNDSSIPFLYYINGSLCGWSENCRDEFGQPMHSYLCLQNRTADLVFNTINLGRVVSILPLKGASDSGLILQFSGGDHFGEMECTASITLYCDPQISTGDPVPVGNSSIINDSSCNIHLAWTSKFACPQCKQKDYQDFYLECIDGTQQHVWVRNNDHCYGGMPLPATEYLPCVVPVSMHPTTATILVVILVIVFVVILAGIGYLYYKHRKLYASYVRLQNNIPLDEDRSIVRR